jgi:hypothetical protein
MKHENAREPKGSIHRQKYPENNLTGFEWSGDRCALGRWPNAGRTLAGRWPNAGRALPDAPAGSNALNRWLGLRSRLDPQAEQ